MTKNEIIEYIDVCIKALEKGQDVIPDLILIKKDLENKIVMY